MLTSSEVLGSILRGNWAGFVLPGWLHLDPQTLMLLSFGRYVGFVILAIVLASLFHREVANVSSLISHHKTKVFLYGLLAGLLFVPVIVALLVSLIGIVLIPLWIMVFAAAVIFGYIGVSHFIGKKILQAFHWHQKPLVIDAIIGVTALYLIGLVPIAGFIVKLIVGCWGLGSVVETRFGVVKGH